jgi:3-hydroxyisobutyrate dehydrogenase
MIGFIGLGKMGRPMATNLLRAGHDIAVYARTPENAVPLVAAGATQFDSPALLARACKVVFTIVGAPYDVHDLYFGGGGLIHNSGPDAILVDMTTSSAAVATEIYDACRKRQIATLDAPVTGGVNGAETARLTFMVGGPETVLDRVHPYFECMGSQIIHMGGAGAGQIAKSCNQVAVAGMVLGATEALSLANKNKIPVEKMLQVLNSGTGSSTLLTALQKRLEDTGAPASFSISQFIKDLQIALAHAHHAGVRSSTAGICLDYCKEIESRNGPGTGLQALLEYYKNPGQDSA